jgi:D-3-phosphoglycerate dehydrogenase
MEQCSCVSGLQVKEEQMIKVACTVPKQRFERYHVFFPDDWDVTYLDYPLSDEAFIDACRGVDFLFVGSVHEVSRNVIINSPSLRMIHTEGVGYNKVDYEAAKEMGIPVCNNRAVNNGAVAEHTVGFMLAGLRRFSQAGIDLAIKPFEQVQKEMRTQGIRELSSQHVGLVGLGAIGQEVARLLAQFGCRISYFDVYRPTKEREKELNVTYLPLDVLLGICDVISLHLPVLPETENIIGAKELSLMKHNAFLINTSRGELIDQDALARALEDGTIYGAALDTVAPEPPEADHPLFNLSERASQRVMITPHVAGTTDEAFERMLLWGITNMQQVVLDIQPNNIVNGVTALK